MLNRTASRPVAKSLVAACSIAMIAAFGMTGWANPSSTGAATGGTTGDVGVSLIVKTTTNPFFVAMGTGAKEAAATDGVNLKLAAGKEDGDEETQIQAIENAISKGDKGILITPNGPAVNDAIAKARDAGLFVIALDTPPDPPTPWTSPSRPTTSRPAS